MITYLRAPRRCLRSSRWGCPTGIDLPEHSVYYSGTSSSHPRGCPTIHLSKSTLNTSVPDEGEGIVSSFASLSTGCRADFFATQILPQLQAHNRVGSDSIGQTRLTTSLPRNSTTKSRTSSAFHCSYEFAKVLPTATCDPHFFRHSSSTTAKHGSKIGPNQTGQTLFQPGADPSRARNIYTPAT
jgi:hypothetical protein